MSQSNNNEKIILDFKKTFNKVKEHVRKKISEAMPTIWASDRLGDVISELDIYANTEYGKFAKRNNMYMYSEEGLKIPQKNFKYLLIIDVIDGTVNMLSNLPFGVNMAFIKIGDNQSTFRIRDIEGVCITNYSTEECFEWFNGQGKKSYKPISKWSKTTKGVLEVSKVYEVPDEISYVEHGDEAAPLRQTQILKAFRTIFPESQRRAIDCTGLRMLEVTNGGLIAYGDWRRATKIWDTIPSIKYILECCKDCRVLNGNLKEYNESQILCEKRGRTYKFNKNLGAEIIVIRNEYYEELLNYFKNKPVFIVYGRAKKLAKSIKEFIKDEFGLNSTLLSEKATKGMHVKAKLDNYSDVKFAVVLMTPDDEGRLIMDEGKVVKAEQKLKTRARQNVIFEMGLFDGLRGGKNIIRLSKGVEETPSDILGIPPIYIKENGEWRDELRKEITAILEART